MKSHEKTLIWTLVAAGMALSSAHAQRRGGGMRGGGMARAAARPSVTARPSMPAARPNIAPPARPNVNRTVNRDVNRNLTPSDINVRRGDVNINRPINVNDVDIHRDVHWDDHYDGCCYHPVATAVGVAAGVALTAAAIGSIVYALPPDCAVTIVNGITYNQCGSVWYQPQFSGTTTTYVVVNAP